MLVRQREARACHRGFFGHEMGLDVLGQLVEQELDVPCRLVFHHRVDQPVADVEQVAVLLVDQRMAALEGLAPGDLHQRLGGMAFPLGAHLGVQAGFGRLGLAPKARASNQLDGADGHQNQAAEQGQFVAQREHHQPAGRHVEEGQRAKKTG